VCYRLALRIRSIPINHVSYVDPRLKIRKTDLKNIIIDSLNSSAREQKLIQLKNKIATVVNEGGTELEGILEPNNFSDSTIFDCTVYYLSG
jgi:vacuolar-type H+-ATPase subunit E/Vma4